MTVIDIDSHYYEPFSWLEETDPELAAELPKVDKVTLVVTTAFGEVLSSLPPQYKPDPFSRIPKAFLGGAEEITPEVIARGEMMLEAWLGSMQGAYKPEGRIAHLDEQGIDQQWILPTFAFNPIARVRKDLTDKTPRILAAYNEWATGNVAGHTDRLMPLVIVDLRTMDRETVVSELKKGRERGSRSFLFWPQPVDDKSLAHPDHEWFWAAAAETGMMPMIHVGAGRPQIDLAWLNNGREFPSQLAAYFAQLHQIPEVLLTELLAAGIFERYPTLRVLVAELGIDWLPLFMRRAKRLGAEAGGMWPYPLSPAEYLQRNVRVSPLHTDPAAYVINEVDADMVVFSSDFPHPEGGQNAVETFKEKLVGKVDDDRVAKFFGETIAEDMALTA